MKHTLIPAVLALSIAFLSQKALQKSVFAPPVG